MGAVQIDEKAVFNTARQIGDADARESYLQLACHDDADALARIRELLRVHEEGRSFLESPARASAPEPPLESTGTVIGPYKLLEQIGEGGFGVVFMAEQTAPVRRKVALKVLKPGMDTRHVIARFEAERQALALMDHPNIARVLDAGTTGTGRPYFVMELVRGIPITEYCDAHRLTPRQRLELFVTVCHAVQHAHQKGIIHRDIKPSNVLVTQHDDRPVAKVIDFGIAKATSGQLTEKTLFTAFAQMIGTPLYMSPEQASMSAIDVDTRSDIYSLGVLLYELLTGTTPFDKARLQGAAFDEIRRIVREEEPATPSARLSTADALPTLAANRGTEPAKLTRLVRGELDWIVLKALEKDRTRRYETADGLAMDVQRYLADEPVSACPPSAAYRLRKLLRRNRRALAVAALVAAMLLVVAGSVGWMARDGAARRARNAAAVAALLGQCEEALEADAAGRAGIALEAAERRATEGGAGELEDRLARCRADLELLRELDAIDMFGWTVVNNMAPSQLTLAARWRAALADYGIAADERGAVDLAVRVNGSLVRDRVLTTLDRWLAAERSAAVGAMLRAADPDPYRDAVRDAITARDGPALSILVGQPEALAQPARFAAVLGALSEVDVPVERRRAVMESALRSRPGDLGLLLGLAKTYVPRSSIVTRPMPSESLRWFQAAVAAHPRSIVARVGLGGALRWQGDTAGAVAQIQEAIRLDPSYAMAHGAMGSIHDDPVAAIPHLRKAIELDPDYGPMRAALAQRLSEVGDRVGAISQLETAIRLDPTNATCHSSLGETLLAHGDTAGAIRHCETAIGLDPDDAEARITLAAALLAKGDTAGAVLQLETAIRLDPDYARVRAGAGRVLLEMGEPERAIPHYEAAVRLDPNDPVAHYNLANVLLAVGDAAGAIRHSETAIRLNPDDADSHRCLGSALGLQGDTKGAIGHLETALRLDPNDAVAQVNLANARTQGGDLAGAAAAYRRAIELAPDNAVAHCNLGLLFMDHLAQFAEAVESLRRGHELGRQQPGWSHPSDRWVRDAERLLALEASLPHALAGHASRPDELLALADMCLRYKKRYVDATLLFGKAFEADPSLAEALNGLRYNAACAAALAGCGRGTGAEGLASSEKARLRGLALEWLLAELAAQGELPAGDPAVAGQVREQLQHWLDDPDLSGIRDAQELAGLPDEERQRWTKLWGDVRDVMARAGKN